MFDIFNKDQRKKKAKTIFKVIIPFVIKSSNQSHNIGYENLFAQSQRLYVMYAFH